MLFSYLTTCWLDGWLVGWLLDVCHATKNLQINKNDCSLSCILVSHTQKPRHLPNFVWGQQQTAVKAKRYFMKNSNAAASADKQTKPTSQPASQPTNQPLNNDDNNDTTIKRHILVFSHSPIHPGQKKNWNVRVVWWHTNATNAWEPNDVKEFRKYFFFAKMGRKRKKKVNKTNDGKEYPRNRLKTISKKKINKQMDGWTDRQKKSKWNAKIALEKVMEYLHAGVERGGKKRWQGNYFSFCGFLGETTLRSKHFLGVNEGCWKSCNHTMFG